MSGPRATRLAVLAMALTCALLLALPGRTVTTAYVNDLLIFLDGAHRVAWGQVPNRDFHTVLGPLVYYIPALGYALSGSLGGAMTWGMALLLLAFAPACAHVLLSRLRPALALPFAAFLILIVAVPINLGDGIGALSFAMFYNRIGWAALALLLVMHLRPASARPRQGLADTLCATLLTLLMLYTKVTYGLVAVAFLALMLIDPRQRRWAGLSLGFVALSACVIELAWQGTVQHARDLLETTKVSGARDPRGPVFAALGNLADLVVFALLAGLALWRTRRFRDAIFYGFCLLSGLLIVNQNAHGWGVVTLYAGAAVAAGTLSREGGADGEASSARRPSPLPAGLPLLLLAFLLPSIIHHGAALGLHFALAMSSHGQPLGLRQFEEVRFARLWSPGDGGFSALYVASFARGAEALERVGTRAERIAVLDFVNPFSAGLGVRPPHGDASWLHWGRNVNEAHHPPPEQLLADVKLVMEPRIGINSVPLKGIYGPYVAEHFDVALRTDLWTVHVRIRSKGE